MSSHFSPPSVASEIRQIESPQDKGVSRQDKGVSRRLGHPLLHRWSIRDVKFGFQIGSDLPQMGQIWDFLRSVSSPNVLY